MTAPYQHSSAKIEQPIIAPQQIQNIQQNNAALWSSDQENTMPQPKNILSAKQQLQSVQESFNASSTSVSHESFLSGNASLIQAISAVHDLSNQKLTNSFLSNLLKDQKCKLKQDVCEDKPMKSLSPKEDAKKTSQGEKLSGLAPKSETEEALNPCAPTPQTCTEAWASQLQSVQVIPRAPLAEIQKDSELRENNLVTLQDKPDPKAFSGPVKVNITVGGKADLHSNQPQVEASATEGAPKKQQKALYPNNHAKSTAFGNASTINLSTSGEQQLAENQKLPNMVRLRSTQQPQAPNNTSTMMIQAESSLTMSEYSADVAQQLASVVSQISQTTDQQQVVANNKAAVIAGGIEVRSEVDDGVESQAYNRKEKSLGELCRRFLFLYGTPQRGLLYLDQCTRELGVERRRIYDIINILESFSVIQRCAKNEYQWRGIDKIVSSIEKQILACKELHQNSAGNNNKTPANPSGSQVIVDDDSSMLSSDNENQYQNHENTGARSKSRAGAKRAATSRAQKSKQSKYKKVKSLGNFCQQFIRLFVTWKDVLSLEEAAKQISDGEIFDEKLLKTKIRRLYDIANVLQSIGLIHKTQMSNSRKPAFKWIGLRGVVMAIQEIKLLVRTAQQELNSKAGSVKSSGNHSAGGPVMNNSGGKDPHSHMMHGGMNWLVKQNSVRCPPTSSHATSKASQSKSGRKGIQSPPQPSPLKLKRSASFIEASPAKGSLIVEQRKRQWAMQQKLAMAAKLGASGQQTTEIQQQQSEGNILEVQNTSAFVSRGGRKTVGGGGGAMVGTAAAARRQPQMALYHQGLIHDDDEDDELMDDTGRVKKLGYIGVRASDSNNPDKVQLFVSSSAAFAAANHTDGGDSNRQLVVVGKKRSRQQQQQQDARRSMGNRYELAENNSADDERDDCEGRQDEELGDEEDCALLEEDEQEDSFVTDQDMAGEMIGEDDGQAYLGGGSAGQQNLLHQQINNTIVKLNKQEEEALIRELESEAMGNDTLKELDEALMDRSTAQKTLRNKTNFMNQHAKINSSNFKNNQEPAQVIRKLKQMSAQASASGCCISASNVAAPLLPVTPAFRLKASASAVEQQSPESGRTPATNHEKEQLLHSRSLSAATTRKQQRSGNASAQQQQRYSASRNKGDSAGAQSSPSDPIIASQQDATGGIDGGEQQQLLQVAADNFIAPVSEFNHQGGAEAAASAATLVVTPKEGGNYHPHQQQFSYYYYQQHHQQQQLKHQQNQESQHSSGGMKKKSIFTNAATETSQQMMSSYQRCLVEGAGDSAGKIGAGVENSTGPAAVVAFNSEFQSPKQYPTSSGGHGSRRKTKQTDKKESQIVKVLARNHSMTLMKSQQLKEAEEQRGVTDHLAHLGAEQDQKGDEDGRLPLVLHQGPAAQQQQISSSHSCSNRDYLLSLQSFRFCLKSLPLIKQLSAGMLEQRTTISKSSHTANDASSQSSQLSIIGH